MAQKRCLANDDDDDDQLKQYIVAATYNISR
jgi:hypothetical protein